MNQNCILNKEHNTVLAEDSVRFVNSKVIFNGKNNILFIAPETSLIDTTISFNGSNSIVYLSPSHHSYRLNLTVYNNQIVSFGANNYFNGKLNLVSSEQTNIIVGNDCLFSFGIWMRTADPHLIYSAKTKKRINPSKSIYIGDHVWIGQDALILKGSKIKSGSIVGAKALVAGKTIYTGTVWGGNPAKQISNDIIWDPRCVHSWQESDTKKNHIINNKENVYKYTKEEYVSFRSIESTLRTLSTDEKFKFLQKLNATSAHNRYSFRKK